VKARKTKFGWEVSHRRLWWSQYAPWQPYADEAVSWRPGRAWALAVARRKERRLRRALDRHHGEGDYTWEDVP